MKINSMRLLAVAAGAMAATAGFAAVTLGTTSTGSITYANELTYSNASPMAGGSNLSLTTPLGFGMGPSAIRYLRLELTNATFAVAVGGGNVPSTANIFAGSSLAAGGAQGGSYVVYTVTASGVGHSPTESVSALLPSLAVTSTASPVTVTYTLFDNGLSAAATTVAANSMLYSATGTVAKFAAALKVTSTAAPAASAQATVASGYKSFLNSAASSTNTGVIGSVAITTDAAVFARNGASQVGLTELLTAAGNTMVAGGDFTAAATSGVFLGDANCGTLGTVATLTSTNTVATFALPANLASAPFSAAANLCYKANGTSQIQSGSYTDNPTLIAASGAAIVQPGTATIGAVSRDGTTLQVPFFQIPFGYKVRFVLTNTGGTDASYIATTTAGPGTVLTAGTIAGVVGTNAVMTGTVPKGGQAVIENADSSTGPFPTFSTGNRGFVVFNVGGSNQVINGVYQLVSPTGGITTVNMVRPVNAYGVGGIGG